VDRVDRGEHDRLLTTQLMPRMAIAEEPQGPSPDRTAGHPVGPVLLDREDPE
jgi:hypothetical protein